jgi:hypothetical protein
VVPCTDKNEIQDLRDVIAVEQEEKKDMQRKLQNAENECKFKLSWSAEKDKRRRKAFANCTGIKLNQF